MCGLWGRIEELFEAATGEEREQILQAIIGRVERQEKESGTCEMAFLPQVPDYRLERIGGLEIETKALRPTSLWPNLAAPPSPVEEPRPQPSRAPWPAVVESVAWEAPTIPTRTGERTEHSAQVTLARVQP